MFFTKRKINEGFKLKHGSYLERVNTCCFLVHLDPRLAWVEHIKNVEDKCKKVINKMRCLSGLEWGGRTSNH